MSANTSGTRSLSLAIAKSEYLEKHHIAEIVSGLLRELVEKHPEEPLQYLSNRLLEVKDGGCPPESALCKDATPAKPAKTAKPSKGREKRAEEDAAPAKPAKLSKGAPEGEVDAEEKRRREKRVEDALLAIAVGAKGAIGPAVVEEAAAKVRRATCKQALSKLTKAAIKDNDYKPHFKKKLKARCDRDKDIATAARKSAGDAQQRFAELVPELAERIASELKRTEAAYWAALEGVIEREPQAMADLEEFTERLNVGPFKSKGVEVQVVVAGRFDHEALRRGEEGCFIQSPSLDRVALRALVEAKDADADGKVPVKLFWEQPDSEFEYKAGFTCPAQVDRRCIYGGEPELTQKLPEGLRPSSVQAFLAIYDQAEKSLPGLNEAVNAAVEQAELALREADAGAEPHIKVKTAPLKAFERAAAKSAEKYKLRFNKLLDVARLTIVCSVLTELVAVLQAINSSSALRIVRMKNRLNPLFPADESAGYRDVLLNVVVLETGCVCEVQVSLAAFVAIKAGGGHGAYKIGRAIGTDRPVETTYAGGLSVEASRRVGSGLTQRLLLEGTEIPAAKLSTLTAPGGDLVSKHVRLVELRMGACGGLTKKEIGSLLTANVCAAMGCTVRFIDLTATGLVGKLGNAPIAEHCVKLETLKLNDNKLVGPIPANFSKLSRLRILSICDNRTLQGKIPPELGEARQLETLELHFCGLTGGIPAELGNLQRLQGLYLNDNKLSGQVPQELGDLRLLRELTLHRNQLSGQIPEGLAQLDNLEDLRLYENDFENADDFKEQLCFNRTQSRNAGMKRLNLAGTQVDDDERNSVSYMLASARSHRSAAVSARSGVSETHEEESDEEEEADSEEAADDEEEEDDDEEEEDDDEEEEEETKD